MSLYSEIKKYLLYLVGFFCLLLVTHFIILYIYKDAIRYPLVGGTMNIGVIGEKPSLDILLADTKIEDNTNDMVFRFLYRSLARYSLEEKKIVGDLANCSLDTFPNIRCTLNQDGVWNDGQAIGTEDVLATYNFLKENTKNPSTKARLALLDVSEDKGDIVFRFRTKDVTAVDTLFLPILRKEDLSQIGTDSTLSTLSYSGPYIFSERDPTTGIIVLKRNRVFEYKKDMYLLDQVRFAFADSQKEVKKLITPDVWLGVSSDNISTPFVKHPYSRPTIYGVYLNAERLPNPLRKALIQDVISRIEYTQDSLIQRENIFLGEVPTSPASTAESLFFQTAFSLGYTFGGTAPLPQVTKTTPRFETLQYVSQPAKTSPSFLSSDVIEIQGSTPNNTNKVVVNDYALRGFRSDKKSFSYIARREFKNLVEGENIYRIQFFNGNRLLAEEKVTIFYHSDAAKLAAIKQEWTDKNTPKPTEPATPPPVVAQTDPKKLYDSNGRIMRFTILAQSENSLFQDIAQKLTGKLEDLGAEVSVQYVSPTDLTKIVSEQNTPYDIVLTNTHLGLFHYDVFPFFHSSQIKNGLNIARIRNASLDSSLEKLTDRLYYNAPDRLRSLQTEIQKILDNESIFFPLGTPQESWYIKNYVLGVRPPSFFAGQEMIFDILAKSYFKEGFKRSTEQKTILGFFLWLKNELFSNT